MWNGKKKALTLSYDDGVMQDKRLVEIFNKYGLKCTFNINSGMLYNECVWKTNGVDVIRMTADECINTYSGHEIAGHSLTHPNLANENDNMIEREIVGDKVNLERIFNQSITGFALPGGANDTRIPDICKRFGIKYVRNVKKSDSFDIPANFYDLTPTAHHNDKNLFKLLDEFISLKNDTPKLFYLWGHSYEFDVNKNWDLIERFCKKVSECEDIYFGTNYEVLSPFFK